MLKKLRELIEYYNSEEYKKFYAECILGYRF